MDVAPVVGGHARGLGALTSRLGRRFVLLFVTCALLPLVVFAAFAVAEVKQQQRRELQATLHNEAKTAGMGLAARLNQVAADLALAAELVQSWRAEGSWSDGLALARQVGQRCASLWLVEGERVQALCGDGARDAPRLEREGRLHLAEGKPVIRVDAGTGRVAMALGVDLHGAEPSLVVAEVRDAWLWQPIELKGAGCEFAATDVHARLLFHTSRRPPPVDALARAAARNDAAGTFTWRVDDEVHVARFWRVFLRPQYDFELLVVQSRPEHEALAVERSFLWWFLLTAVLTLLVVVFVSLVQMRRALDPIVSLGDATRRLGEGDLDVRVSIESKDEFGDLGAAFNEMAHHLQENIRERERTERELVASRDAALAAAKAKAEFVTNVSHEFRTPMAEILGAAEILTQLDDEDVAAREEFSGIALHGARRLARLLDDVLALGQTTSRERVPVDVVASVEAAAVLMPPDVRARVRLECDHEEPPVVHGDEAALTGTWCRLLDNAAKFSPADAPIVVRVRGGGGRVEVDVVDEGVGIAAADQERIFEPFSQVGRDQMVDKAHGAGLGLTLARSAVEAHGGSIAVVSAEGAGSTFRVALPARAAEPVVEPSGGA